MTFNHTRPDGRVTVPDGWADLDAFAEWYLSLGAPMMIPWDAEVITTDDATAICLFRKAPYQAEIYLIHPGEFITEHAHPGMEAMTIYLGGGKRGGRTETGSSAAWGALGARTMADQTHGGGTFGFFKEGFAMLSLQRWPVGVPITSAAIHWKGETSGPKHDALIKRHHPHAVAVPGFADITRRKTEAIL